MYCNKKNVNLLTALLIEHGVKDIVVCPGSRNAPIVHNFSQCKELKCYPATDERSAGFLALGLRQHSSGPVAVCVTSGSALLNVLPAAAEATYQQQGIVVISADRPAAWIDQLDGQTLPQPGALGAFAACSVSLPEVAEGDSVSEWHCNRLINEALLQNQAPGHPTVHINVPISEPLFEFTTEHLPACRVVRGGDWREEAFQQEILKSFAQAQRPMIIVGQTAKMDDEESRTVEVLQKHAVMLTEPISGLGFYSSYTDDMMCCEECTKEETYLPDWVLYVGGHTVSKRLRQWLRLLPESTLQIVVSEEGKLRDVSQHTQWLVRGTAQTVLDSLAESCQTNGSLLALPQHQAFVTRWEKLRQEVAERIEKEEPAYSSAAAVRDFEERIDRTNSLVYYANSMAIRLAARYAKGYCYCNRGVNGIEGSLSVAAGASLARPDQKVFCVIGDLSFFYDQNALWQQQLGGNFRVLLLNNGIGGIFRQLKGLEQSPVRDTLVAGQHQTSAAGICLQFDVAYQCATDTSSLQAGLQWLCETEANRPLLLEVKVEG